MLRFRNPGSQYSTQIEIIKKLYKDYGESESFSLDDIATTVARDNMMTAYGYSGNNAIALSTKEDRSLDSAYNNAKMYAEIYRNLGWLASLDKTKSYPLTFTLLGKYVAESDDPLSLYQESIIGMNTPQEIINVKYAEKTRFFKTVLNTIKDMNNILYKHELCLGPMSISDTNREYGKMISYLKGIRGSYKNYKNEYNNLLKKLNVKPSLPDNSTRFPIAAMKTCGWIEDVNSSSIYPPKMMKCFSLTTKGIDYLKKITNCKDLRLDEFKKYPKNIQESLIRVGFYSALKRAGYDIRKVKGLNNDNKICQKVTGGKELLFSPYQTIFHNEVDLALGYTKSGCNRKREGEIPKNVYRNGFKEASLNFSNKNTSKSRFLLKEDIIFIYQIKEQLKTKTVSKIIERIMNLHRDDTQNQFYPFVAQLFRIAGYNCKASRQGDNGSRWDAIIIDNKNSIPIEIKSPTEEKNISLKAIRQALENKIILLSRKTFKTSQNVSSFVVGYYYPNDRSDVNDLVTSFNKTYNIKIGIIDIRNLLLIALTTIKGDKVINEKEFISLEGICNVVVK